MQSAGFAPVTVSGMSALSYVAPNFVSGSSTRFIGRLRRLASPVKVAAIGVVAMAPITSREPVPELPKSSVASGAANPPTPTPFTRQVPGPSRVTVAPKARMASAVFSTSSASSRPVIRVSPTASAPRIRARWEIDLSPATRATPRKGREPRARKGPKGLGMNDRGQAHKAPLTAGERSGKRPPLTKRLHAGRLTLVKADLGIKRVCPNCTTRFYDLQKRPIECPKCEFSFEPESLYKQRRPRVAEPVAQVQPAAEDDEENEDAENEDTEAEDEAEEEEVVVDEAPLIVPGDDDEEEEAAEAEEEDAGMTVVDADADPEIEDIEVEDDEDDDAAGLLEEEEDEDDVSDIIDADIEKDDR